MILHIVSAEYRGGYKVFVRFNDGTSGEVDLTGKLAGAVFEPLTDKNRFARFHVDSELGTIVWENGADLAPEYLKDMLESRSQATQKKLAKGVATKCAKRRKSA